VKNVQVIWSSEALVDLETIYDFLAEKSVTAAKSVVEKILSRTKQIEAFPASGSKHETKINTGRDYRYLVEQNYKIIYSLHPERQVVFIEIIFDTRQNPDDIRE
jgi:toxin ParE1/3/4